MPLLNAEEDFAQRTLGTLQNVWEKLAYVSGLKSSEGSYDHWGLASVHGREVASQAIAKAHSEVLRETLATPLQKLHTFERNSAISAEKKPHLFMTLINQYLFRLVSVQSRLSLDMKIFAMNLIMPIQNPENRLKLIERIMLE